MTDQPIKPSEFDRSKHEGAWLFASFVRPEGAPMHPGAAWAELPSWTDDEVLDALNAHLAYCGYDHDYALEQVQRLMAHE